jgi:hypothetical protein
MHRSIIPIPDNMLCDHINHIGLDNRSANLRPATSAQNAWNRKKQSKPTSSKYKGVRKTISNTWSADITVLGKRIHLGSFKTETAAAKAYDSAAKTHFGLFAYTNFSHNKFPNLNRILTPVKVIPQLLLFLACILITLLRTIKPLPTIITTLLNIQTAASKFNLILITALACFAAFQSPISIFLLLCFFSSFPPFALIFPCELPTTNTKVFSLHGFFELLSSGKRFQAKPSRASSHITSAFTIGFGAAVLCLAQLISLLARHRN